MEYSMDASNIIVKSRLIRYLALLTKQVRMVAR